MMSTLKTFGTQHALTLSLVFTFTLLFGCSGSGSGSGGGIIPPVQAQTGYSNASIEGAYVFAFGSRATQEGYIGTINADGNGNITGTLNSQTYHGATCGLSISGSYTVQSSGAGTLMWTLSPSGSAPCSPTDTDVTDIAPQSFLIEVAQQGALFEASGNNNYNFTAAKQ